MELNNLKVTSKNILLIGILFLVLPNVSAVIINEIMYNPASITDPYNEWIELYNDQNFDIELNGWTVDDKKINENITLQPNEHIILARKLLDGTPSNPDSFESVWGNGDGVWNQNDGYLATEISLGLTNTGKTITLKDSSGATINSVTYDPASGANGDGNSLQLCGSSWAATSPTPGSSNSCSTPNPQNQAQNTNQTSNLSQTNNQTEENTNISTSENNTSNNVVKTEPKLSSTGNTIKEDEVIVLNSLDTKDINNEESAKKSDKSNYAKYILTAFVFLLALLFLLKGKIFKKEYKNEFKK